MTEVKYLHDCRLDRRAAWISDHSPARESRFKWLSMQHGASKGASEVHSRLLRRIREDAASVGLAISDVTLKIFLGRDTLPPSYRCHSLDQ
jgi:hypothetical protein